MYPDVSEENTPSITMPEDEKKQAASKNQKPSGKKFFLLTACSLRVHFDYNYEGSIFFRKVNKLL
jgi:hypothetical protein